MITQTRCSWPGSDPLMIHYHDTEWGVPVHDDNLWFEYIVLDAAQAGLSWKTVLHKRENYRTAFANFQPEIVAGFTDKDFEKLMQNPGIIRNRLKINSAIKNAQAFLKIQKEQGSFDNYIWPFVGGSPIKNAHLELQDVPAVTPEAEELSRDLKSRGFTFVGPTITYAFMQAGGLVNDHLVSCFRYEIV